MHLIGSIPFCKGKADYVRSFPKLTPFSVLNHLQNEAAKAQITHQIILFLAFFTHLQ